LTRRVEELTKERNKLTETVELNAQQAHVDFVNVVEEKENLRRERDKFEKKLTTMHEDRDRLRQRLRKYRARKKLFELGKMLNHALIACFSFR
jgi:chromosome segregation ATPase